MDVNNAFVEGQQGFVAVGKDFAGTLGVVTDDCQVETTQHDVLGRGDNRVTRGWRQNVVLGQHAQARFFLGFFGQRHVHCHLVAVKVGVEGGTDQWVQLNGRTLDEIGFEGLD